MYSTERKWALKKEKKIYFSFFLTGYSSEAADTLCGFNKPQLCQGRLL